MYLAALSSAKMTSGMINVARKILNSYSIEINIQDAGGNTALHTAITNKNGPLFKEILLTSSLQPNLNLKNKNEQTVLWLSLIQSEEAGKLEVLTCLYTFEK
jgi:ankyrin repeat protein